MYSTSVMEFGGIVDALEDKSILITGSTGFLAKIFVEKVLRVQPKVKRLYLLVRARDTNSAEKRLQNEVIQKELFDLLRKQHGEEFHSFITEKVSPIPGDIIHENLGIEDIKMRELLWKEIKMVIHSAATTNFYGRYDTSLNINVLGPMHVINFAKRCKKLEMFLHVSTAYVTGEKQGLLLEKAFSMGETLKDNLYLDISSEIKLIERKKQELRLDNSGIVAEKKAMKELGIERARHFGWTNTYVFTKAMGEMLLGKLRGSLPLVIARPTMITSTWKEPFPGWVEENGTIDNVIVGCAKGILPCVAVDSELPIDLIPGDMVVNAMIAMAVAHSNQQAEFIYHISSSVRNPVNYSILDQCMSRYFSKNPLFGEEGRAISMPNVPVFKTLAKFHVFIFLRYYLPMEMLRLVNYMLCLFPKKYSNLSQKYGYAMRMVDLYQPYCFVKRCYVDTNLERLRMATKEHTENLIFYFDPKDIDWEAYFYNAHIPGVVKYAAADFVGNIQQLHPNIMGRKSKL